MCFDTEKTQAPNPDWEATAKRQILERAREAQRPSLTNDALGATGNGVDPLDVLFRYHPPSLEDLPRFEAINLAAKNFAAVVRANCGRYYGRDYLRALDAIMDARMLANRALAVKGNGF